MNCIYKATQELAPPGETHYRCVNKGCGHERTSAYGPHQLHRRCNAAPSGTSLSARLGRYARAMKRWWDAGKPVRTDDEVAALLDICRRCEYYDARGKCALCDCPINIGENAAFNKLRMATEQCPDNPPRWPAKVTVDESSEG